MSLFSPSGHGRSYVAPVPNHSTRHPAIRFFFNDTATTEIYTLSLHDALPISPSIAGHFPKRFWSPSCSDSKRDRKSTRLNSSHVRTSYAVFCLKKKNGPPDRRNAETLPTLVSPPRTSTASFTYSLERARRHGG